MRKLSYETTLRYQRGVGQADSAPRVRPVQKLPPVGVPAEVQAAVAKRETGRLYGREKRLLERWEATQTASDAARERRWVQGVASECEARLSHDKAGETRFAKLAAYARPDLSYTSRPAGLVPNLFG